MKDPLRTHVPSPPARRRSPECGRPCADVADKAHRMYGYCGDECMRAQERLDQERRIQELKDQGMLVRRVVRRIA